MESGFNKANSSNLPKIDTVMLCKFFAMNTDFCSSEFRSVKTSISSTMTAPGGSRSLPRRMRLSTIGSRAISWLASTSPKDYKFESFVFCEEKKHPLYWSWKRLIKWLCSIGEHDLWVSILCILTMVALLQVAADIDTYSTYTKLNDITYNFMYAIHFSFTFYVKCKDAANRSAKTKVCDTLGLIMDVLSYAHYLQWLLQWKRRTMKIVCYYLRLHVPFSYLWAASGSNLSGSMVGMTLKYFFFSVVLRINFSLLWNFVAGIEEGPRLPLGVQFNSTQVDVMLSSFTDHFGIKSGSDTSKFVHSMYIVNNMFLPLGPSVEPQNDKERVMCLIIMLTGSLVVTGAAVTSLTLVISLYMRPEEEFRARFKLIMNEMESTHVPTNLREKVKTFYKMYWHKQRAVSETQLLPIFPPTMPSTIYTDIYFEAQQKSHILRDVSYQFLWEVSKCMSTIHFIPGDVIIKRMSDKSSIIYITYGDIEMLTPEDDDTAILRMTCGTMISPCGGCAAAACGKSQVEIRAATYCTAQVLTASNLWKTAVKYGKANGQSYIILASFEDHLEKVMKHFSKRARQPFKYKSSILQLKRNLMTLKEAKDEKGNLLLARSDYFLELARTYVMRNRADSSLTDEADEVCLRPTFPCILRPDTSMLVTFDILMCIIILVVTFTHPYHLIFLKDVPLKFRFFDYFVSGLFILDIYVYLSTGTKVEEGVAITFVQISMQQMKSGWFILDVLSILPFFEIIGDGKLAGINKLLRVPKVFRILKSMEDKCVYHSNVLRFMSYTLLTLIASYIIASIQQSYMCLKLDLCAVKNFTQEPIWVNDPNDTNVANRLFYGLFWGVSVFSFTCYKVVSWYTNYWMNVVYTIVLLEGCVILKLFMDSMYSATILVTSAMRKNFEATITDVKAFLVTNHVDPKLQQRFITYLKLCWHTDKAYSITHKKNSIFFDLPPHVYQDIVSEERINYILCVPFMKYLNSKDLKAVASESRFYHTSPNEILQNTGDVGNEIFVIKEGFCEIFDPTTQQPVCIIGKKDYFGVLECLLRVPVYYSVRAVTHVKIFSIRIKTLHYALKIPRIREAIKYCKSRPEYANIQARKETFLKYKCPPPIPNFCRFPLRKKYEPDTAFIEPFTRLGFWSILRYIFPRFTIRPDGQYIYQYEVFRAFCALTACMIFPSYTYMVLEFKWLTGIRVFLRLTAYFDIIQRCLVAYYDKDGILISHPSSTTAHYLKGAFIVDLIACVPLENLEHDPFSVQEYSNSTDRVKLNPIKQFLMMNRLLQMYRVPGAMDVLSTVLQREDIILVIKAIPFFTILNNVLACLMVFSSVDIYGPSATEPWSIVPKGDLYSSWLYHYKHQRNPSALSTIQFNITESPSNLHLAIYSWIVYETTNTGRDMFQPSNLQLLMILFIGIIVGTMMTTYFSVQIISMRANVNTLLASYQENLWDIIHYMKKENLNAELQKDVLQYYEYNWDHTGGIDARNVLKLCDQITLRTDAILHLYGTTFTSCPILCTSEPRLLRVVGRAVHCLYFLKDTRIVEEDDVLTYMYFVHHGTVEVGRGGEVIDRLPRGSVFGNLENVHALRSPTYIQALTNSHILQINSKMFYAIIMDFPKVEKLLKKNRTEFENFIVGELVDTSESSSKCLAHIDEQNMNIVSKYNFTYSINFLSYLIIISLISIFGETYHAFFESKVGQIMPILRIIDMLFYVKLTVNILLPYFVPYDQIETIKRCRKQYMRTEFKYDLLSVLPLENLEWILNLDDEYNTFFRLNRIFRIATINICLQRRPQTIFTNLMLYAIVTVVIWFLLFIHINTCLFYVIGTRDFFMKTNSSWLFDDTGNPVCENHYICTYFFIMTTFTHKGVGGLSFIPKQKLETLFVNILELISAMMYMIYVGEFSNIIQFRSFRPFSYYCKFLELQNFLNNHRVSKNLVKMVSRYSLHLWRESRGVQIPYFLEMAPPCFKLNIMSAAYMRHLLEHSLFGTCEPAFLRQLVGTLVLYRYREDMHVVKEGEITNAMYLIHTGNVVEYDEYDEEVNEKFVAGDCFGLLQGLIRDTPYAYSYKTTIKAEVLTLTLDDWEHLLRLFPESRYNIYKGYPDHPYSKSPEDRDSPDIDKDLYVSSDLSQISFRMSTPEDSKDIKITESISLYESPSEVIIDGDTEGKPVPNFTPSPLSISSRASTADRENVAKNAAAQMLVATTIWTPPRNSEVPAELESLDKVVSKSEELHDTRTSIVAEATRILNEIINRTIRLALVTTVSESDISTKQQSSLVTLTGPSDATLVESSSPSTTTIPLDKTGSQASVKTFRPPPGPSLADIGPPVILDNIIWPLDSRSETKEKIRKPERSVISDTKKKQKVEPVADSDKSERLTQNVNDENSFATMFQKSKTLFTRSKLTEKSKPSKPSMIKRSVAFQDSENPRKFAEVDKTKKTRRISSLIPHRRSRVSFTYDDTKSMPSTSKHTPENEASFDTDVTSESNQKELVIKDDEEELQKKNKPAKGNKNNSNEDDSKK